MTAFKRSQAKYVKHAYKTTNWPEYEAGLRDRGSLTVWISEDELKGWVCFSKRRPTRCGAATSGRRDSGARELGGPIECTSR